MTRWPLLSESVPLDHVAVNSPVSLRSDRNTEAGAGRTGGRSHRGHSAALPHPLRTQPQPTLHVEVSQCLEMEGRVEVLYETVRPSVDRFPLRNSLPLAFDHLFESAIVTSVCLSSFFSF